MLGHLTADDPLVERYIKMCQGEGIDIAGIEFIEDADGERYTYDINGTTNYSGVFAQKIGIDGMREFARYARGDEAVRVGRLATRPACLRQHQPLPRAYHAGSGAGATEPWKPMIPDCRGRDAMRPPTAQRSPLGEISQPCQSS